MSADVVIIAALEREVRPLVKGWRVVQGSSLGAYRTFEQDDVLVVCAGIGSRAASKTIDKVLSRHRPKLLISAGLAGSLVPDLKVGEVFIPATIISSRTGAPLLTGQGNGTLVSASGIAGPEAKRLLARQYNAIAVDMEAASVAIAAVKNSIPFTAVKAISDENEFAFPEMDTFIDPHGRFSTTRFLSHVALRPALWPVVRKLSANTRLASQNLCAELRNLLENRKRQPASAQDVRLAGQEKETRAR